MHTTPHPERETAGRPARAEPVKSESASNDIGVVPAQAERPGRSKARRTAAERKASASRRVAEARSGEPRAESPETVSRPKKKTAPSSTVTASARQAKDAGRAEAADKKSTSKRRRADKDSRSRLARARAMPKAEPSPSPMRGPSPLTTVLDFIERQLGRCRTVQQQAGMFALLATFLIVAPLAAFAWVAGHVLPGLPPYALVPLLVAAAGGGGLLFARRLGPVRGARSAGDPGRTEIEGGEMSEGSGRSK